MVKESVRVMNPLLSCISASKVQLSGGGALRQDGPRLSCRPTSQPAFPRLGRRRVRGRGEATAKEGAAGQWAAARRMAASRRCRARPAQQQAAGEERGGDERPQRRSHPHIPSKWCVSIYLPCAHLFPQVPRIASGCPRHSAVSTLCDGEPPADNTY